MLQASFTVTPKLGDVIATDFTVNNSTSGANIKKYAWDFGTGEVVYNVSNPSYIYKAPGIYTISLTATDFNGNESTAQQTVTADIVYRDYIRFSHIPEQFADPGKLTTTPFKVDIVSSNPDKPIVVDLFASNSNSTPEQFVPQRWNFLNPTWKFLDVNKNFVTSLSVTPIPLYKNDRVVAVSGTTEFYYVDSASKGDPTKNCPILITVNLQTSGFSNFKDSYIYSYPSYANNKTVRTGIVWYVNDLFPNTIKVTSNYINEIYPKQWKNIKIPILITCHSNRSLFLSGSEDSLSEVIFTYPESNDTGKKFPVNLRLSELQPSSYIVDEAPLYFQAEDDINSRTGGYIFTTVTPNTTAESTSIVAEVTAESTQDNLEDIFPYPFGYAPNVAVWVSNPEKSTLNKITLIPDPGICKTINYYRENNILTDGIVKEIKVPALSTSTTFNYTISGFSGIYGVAIDPRNYDLIAADAELDRIYRLSNTGEILKTFELTSLGDFDPQQKLFEHWTWKAVSPTLSSTGYTLYKPTPISNAPKNYIVTVGGVMQPTDCLSLTESSTYARLVIVPSLSSINYVGYPPEKTEINLIQIYNPALPSKYIESIYYATTALSTNTTEIFLPDAPSLSANTNHYIVSIEGILQAPTSFNVDNDSKTIKFTEKVPQNSVINVVYLPELINPTNWVKTYTEPTNTFSFTGLSNYQLDDKSTFLVNIGGVIQSPKSYKHVLSSQELIFTDFLPTNVPIYVTQFSVADTINTPAAYTPAYISLDSNYNIWVSLFNSVSVLKFDPDFNLLFSAVPNINWQSRAWTVNPEYIDYQSSVYGDTSRYYDPSAVETDPYTNEFFLKPSVVETDRENNCWATYSHPLCSMLVKYSETGQVLTQIPLTNYRTPINLAINPSNNVWVANFHGSTYTDAFQIGNIELYDTNNNSLIKTINGFARPGNISLDRYNNLWFTHGTRNIGYYNTVTDTLCSWTLNLTGGFSVYIQTTGIVDFFNEYENQEDEEIGGLSVDVFNRVWVLDTVQNFAWVISATPDFNIAPIRYFKIVPDVTLGYYVNNDGQTYTETGNYYYRSAQATGDWTGNKWYQKYAVQQILANVQLTGVSSPFKIKPFKNDNQIRRINESFNSAEYYKSLALPEILNNNNNLWNGFFAAAVGTSMLSTNEDLGQITYERIANFVDNHIDVDTCNIDQLLCLAEQTGTPASDYSAIFPTEIRNMLDIASVPRSKLWGIPNNVPLLRESIGKPYNTQTDTITAGTKIVFESKFDNSLSVIQVPPYFNQLIYPLALFQFEERGFEDITFYNFYRFNPTYSDEYVENLIDWKSEYTTLQPTTSSIEEWYGEDGIIETAFRYILTKNLYLK